MKTGHVNPHKSFMYLWIIGAVFVLAGLGYSYIQSHPAGVIDGQHEGDVRTTIAAFGNHLNTVSLLSPTVTEDIRNAYGPFVTPELLSLWEANPSTAPGRKASSPWPDHIEVDSVVMNVAGSYDVSGRIILAASNTTDAGSIRVVITVTDIGGSYLISKYDEMDQVSTQPVPAVISTVTIAIGETKKIGDLSLTPLEVVEDSRCPTDVQCIQAGTVRVNVKVATKLGETENVFVPGVAMTTEAETITLTGVTPGKVSTQTLGDADYRFTFETSAR